MTEDRSIKEASEDKNQKAVVQQTYKNQRSGAEDFLGYTLNLYSTKNKMLLNGKDIDQFMDRHLPIVHEIMFQPVRDGLLRNVSQSKSPRTKTVTT